MGQLSLQQLESHLWESANILRGSIDSSDYKNYIFGMLFLKRLNDVFVEKAEQIQREFGEDYGWTEPVSPGLSTSLGHIGHRCIIIHST